MALKLICLQTLNIYDNRYITSKGVNSGIRCIFSMHSATHPLSEINVTSYCLSTIAYMQIVKVHDL